MRLVPGQQAQVDEAAAVKTLTFVRSLLNDTIASRSGDGGTATSEFERAARPSAAGVREDGH